MSVISVTFLVYKNYDCQGVRFFGYKGYSPHTGSFMTCDGNIMQRQVIISHLYLVTVYITKAGSFMTMKCGSTTC